MKLRVLSDLHREFAPFEPAPDLEFDAVILAGDIHSPAKRAVQWLVGRFRGNPRGYLNLALSRHGEFKKDFKPELVIDV